MVYVYAITAQPEVRWPALRGLEEAPVFGLRYGDLAAAVSRVSGDPVPASEDNVWRHETVVEALMVSRTVLPVRFGTVLGGGRAVQDVMTEHYDDFACDLTRLHGRVELGLRVLDPEGPDECRPRQESGPSEEAGTDGPDSLRSSRPLQEGAASAGERPSYGSGRAYLVARSEQERRERSVHERAESLAAELHAPLQRLSAHSTHRVLATPRLLLTAAYLLDRPAVALFRQEIDTLGRDYPHLRFLCTGPWPPYSFVTTAVSTS
jgi:hypothetical protein